MQCGARTRSCIDLKVCTFQKRFTSSCQWMALPTWNIARKHLLDTCRTGQNHYWRQDPGIQAMSAACEGRTRKPSSRALHPAAPDDAWIGGRHKKAPVLAGTGRRGRPRHRRGGAGPASGRQCNSPAAWEGDTPAQQPSRAGAAKPLQRCS